MSPTFNGMIKPDPECPDMLIATCTDGKNVFEMIGHVPFSEAVRFISTKYNLWKKETASAISKAA